MRMTEHNVVDFIKLMASDTPAPGGGSASALAGAVGAALGCMVAEFTIGKPKYAASEETMKEILNEAGSLSDLLVGCIDKDTEAFNCVTSVFAMPKSTEEEKADRKNAMQEALKKATLAPFETMSYAHNALKVIEQAVGNSNPNTASDLGVAALNLKSAVQGAWLNVLINLAGITDSYFVMEYKVKGEQILNESCELADSIYGRILRAM